MKAPNFKFGENWKNFSSKALTDEAIRSARSDFERLCQGVNFDGVQFLDIGFGQGLALCLASEKGATSTGLDLDPLNGQAFELTASKFALPNKPQLVFGSILDDRLCAELKKSGPYDIVHSWGVLHHTGNCRRALHNAVSLVKEGGYFIVAIYNAHWSSPFWKAIKWTYNKLPPFLQRWVIAVAYILLRFAFKIVTKQSPDTKVRGMNFYYDVIDWVGGYPYEYMTKEEIISAVPKSFEIVNYIAPIVPTGNHQLVFRMTSNAGTTNLQESARSRR